MTDFAAIDFEIANYHRSSVCSVGVVIVRNGRITEKIYRLIHPEPEWYLWRCTQIHGLTAKDTTNVKIFPFVWQEIAPKLEGLPLVVHNVVAACRRRRYRKGSDESQKILFRTAVETSCTPACGKLLVRCCPFYSSIFREVVLCTTVTHNHLVHICPLYLAI